MNINFMNTNFININNQFYNTPLSFNDFIILQKIGEGYFGSVYKVQYKKDMQIYAIKSYDKSKSTKDSAVDYIREKAILYDLNQRGNSSIVKLYADFEDLRTRNLVMECVEGTTLKKLRGNFNGYVPQKDITNILYQLLETLQFLHDKCHIVHRDIKPHNIIIQKNNKIKLLDFGISAYLENPNKILVSQKSFKGQKHYIAPEILLLPPPFNYDYKIDIFALGFTMYSVMNPTNNSDEDNLPKKTEGVQGMFSRRNVYIKNDFYDQWLIDFVESLYDDDQNRRPKAIDALNLLQKFLTNPKVTYIFNNLKSKASQENINNMNMQFMRSAPTKVINNFNTTVPNPMSSSAQQINTMMNNNIPFTSVQRMNSSNITQINRKEPLFLNAEMSNDNRVLSSMKSLLQVLLRLDGMDFIQAQTFSLFTYMNIDYSKYFIHSYHQMLNSILPKNLIPNQVAQVIYNQNVNEFIRKVFLNNNSGISGNRPIILFYMIISILKDDFLRYFNHYQNHILDHIIQNNFMSLNSIIPMTDPTIYNSISHKNKYKGPLVDNFYFFILSVSRCSRCNNLFGIRTLVAQFLQLDVKNPQNNILDLINNYFAIQNGLKNCNKCGIQVQKMKKLYLLNAPNYLILEFEDKNFVNFNSNIMLPLFNGMMCQYEYVSAIYKLKINNITDFVAVFKYNNNLFFYSDDKICSCPPNYINSQCPSLAIFKKISK